MERRIHEIIPEALSRHSETPRPLSPPPARTASFFQSFVTVGQNWTPEEIQFAESCKAHAVQAAWEMANHREGYSLAFLGQTSSGKTMIARLIRRYWNTMVLPKETSTGQMAVAHHCAKISWPSHDWNDLEDERSAACVMIDELGRGERGKDGQAWGRFLEFFNFRQERKLWTIVTCNLRYDEIRAVDPAIASRLRRNRGIVIQAGDNVRPFEDR